MTQPKECLKCGGARAQGYIADNNNGRRGVSSWVAGAPHRTRWFGVKLAGKTPTETETWRCERCGFLESYAPPA